VRTAYCIADALSYLHSRNIIFRDLKPANVGFDSSGVLKLFDFGFATGLDDGADEEGLLHDVCGTPRYMAPEVDLVRGYSLPADVHSFGILLWEICSLKKPFAKVKSHEEFRLKVYQRGGRPKLSKYWPAALRETMANCWGSFPGERPTMASVKTILGACVREMQQNSNGGSDLRKSSVFRRLTG
jgi:serine/threonine protein kinase